MYNIQHESNQKVSECDKNVKELQAPRKNIPVIVEFCHCIEYFPRLLLMKMSARNFWNLKLEDLL